MAWQQHRIRIHGREVACPRLSAWYGDSGARYSYSGMVLDPVPWIPPLLELKRRIESLPGGLCFNSVLINRYRDGSDSMGWHSDDEPELGPEPDVASVSLGGPRRFLLRHRSRRDVPNRELQLAHGSLLVMRAPTQRFWKHAVPKTRRTIGERVNLTFRRIVS